VILELASCRIYIKHTGVARTCTSWKAVGTYAASRASFGAVEKAAGGVVGGWGRLEMDEEDDRCCGSVETTHV
jgi:hypothetical protein